MRKIDKKVNFSFFFVIFDEKKVKKRRKKEVKWMIFFSILRDLPVYSAFLKKNAEKKIAIWGVKFDPKNRQAAEIWKFQRVIHKVAKKSDIDPH